eukprot:TRINITY_DN38_c0_g1_i3.p2 TRINITY_DN38_c0_g1~~TRINITY_DN38_c0_g1_i3.p2  ORF type:complete len:258 (+),score=-20.28 TRINITY_DN38_c0_g1_i3:1226-1999(+)
MLHLLSHITRPNQSQTQQGLLSPLFILGLFSKLYVRRALDRDVRNLIHPFMHVTNQMTRHLATLRESQLLPPFTCACSNLFAFTFEALGRNHCVSTSSKDHHKALFQLNSRIPLARTSSEPIVLRKGSPPPSTPAWRRSALTHKKAVCAHPRQPHASGDRLPSPTLRANLYPKVTDPQFRLQFQITRLLNGIQITITFRQRGSHPLRRSVPGVYNNMSGKRNVLGHISPQNGYSVQAMSFSLAATKDILVSSFSSAQ